MRNIALPAGSGIIMAANFPNPDLTHNDTTSQTEDPIPIPKTSAASQPSADMKSNGYHDEQQAEPQQPEIPEKTKVGMDARTKISSLLKDKEQEWTAVVEKRKGPLRLLDLPMDVLKEIVKEVAFPSISHLYVPMLSTYR